MEKKPRARIHFIRGSEEDCKAFAKRFKGKFTPTKTHPYEYCLVSGGIIINCTKKTWEQVRKDPCIYSTEDRSFLGTNLVWRVKGNES